MSWWEKGLLAFLVLVVILAVVAMGFAIHHDWVCRRDHHRGHYVTKHVKAYTSFHMVGKVTVPIYHPAHDYQTWVCDQPEGHE
jgi:hypothetical protein